MTKHKIFKITLNYNYDNFTTGKVYLAAADITDEEELETLYVDHPNIKMPRLCVPTAHCGTIQELNNDGLKLREY